MGVRVTVGGKHIAGRKMTTADAQRIQYYLGKVQTIGVNSDDLRVVVEAAKEELAKRASAGQGGAGRGRP
jgi:hypothetical protein